MRVLKARLETGFEDNGGLAGREDLVRKLLGSPALVKTLEGVERRIAVDGYVGGLTKLFVAGSGLALVMVLVQAATGWRGAKSEEVGVDDGEREIGIEDEEWEEGMEQGV